LDLSSAFPSGKTNVTGLSGEAELAISISGRKGKGTIYVIATKSAGEWQYSKLIVKTDDGETIDLNQNTEPNVPRRTTNRTTTKLKRGPRKIDPPSPRRRRGRYLQLESGAQMRDEALGEFDGIASGKV
jgi:hypothetical protein